MLYPTFTQILAQLKHTERVYIFKPVRSSSLSVPRWLYFEKTSYDTWELFWMWLKNANAYTADIFINYKINMSMSHAF